MRFFFDNCVAPRVAHTIHGFIAPDGDEAVHLRDQFPPNVSDIDWLTTLGQSHLRWVFVTGDTKIARNPGQKAALLSSGLCGFVLASAFQKYPTHQAASLLLWKWPQIRQQADLVTGAALFQIQASRNARLKQMNI